MALRHRAPGNGAMGMWVGVGEPQKLRGAAILGRAEGSSLVSFKHQHPGKFQQYHRPRKGSLNPQDVPRKNLDGLQKRVFEDPSQRNRRRASTPSLGIYLPIFLQVRMSGRACMHLYMRTCFVSAIALHTYGSFRKFGGTLFGVLIMRILLLTCTILGSPIFGNSHIETQRREREREETEKRERRLQALGSDYLWPRAWAKAIECLWQYDDQHHHCCR